MLNNRLSKMFAGMGQASDLPNYEQVQPPAAPQIEGSPSGPLPGGESPVDELTRGGPGTPPPTAPDTSQTFSRGGKMGTPQGIADQVTAAKTGATANATARVDAHKVAKAAIGNEVQAPVAPSTVGNTVANSPDIVAFAQEAAAQKLFNKPFSQLELSDKMKAIREATAQQTASVQEANAFYTQARAELGAKATPEAVKARADQMMAAHVAAGAPPPVTPVTPTMRQTRSQTLTQRMQAQPLPTLRRVTPPTAPGGITASPRQQATALMLLVKQGKLSPAEADSKIQRLVGPGGRRTVRMPVGPE